MGVWYGAATAAGLCGAFSHRAVRLLGERRFGRVLFVLAALLCAVLTLVSGAIPYLLKRKAAAAR